MDVASKRREPWYNGNWRYGTALSALVIGLPLLLLSAPIMDYILTYKLVLAPEGFVYNIWRDAPFPITTDFFLFNWTNPADIHDNSTRPRLQEIGPYRFRQVKKKVAIIWNDNDTVSFQHRKSWTFDSENSNGSLDDLITTIDPVAVSAIAQASNYGYLLQQAMAMTVNSILKDVHTTRSVREMLFEGYDDTMLTLARTVPAMKGWGVQLPPFDKFGWFYMRNNSADAEGVYTMGTGAGSLGLGAMDRWNGMTQTGWFPGDCGRVEGSAGELWGAATAATPAPELRMFMPDVCRTGVFPLAGPATAHGLQGVRYVGAAQTVDNGSMYPETQCFCRGACPPTGVMDVSTCRYGAPGYISFPHFYAADAVYLQQVEGLKPDPAKHELSIILEPTTGIPIEVSAKFQVNLLLKPNPQIKLYSDVPEVMFPVMWFREEVGLTDDLAATLRLALTLPATLRVVGLVLIIAGFLALLALWWARTRHAQRTRALKQDAFLLRADRSENDVKILKG